MGPMSKSIKNSHCTGPCAGSWSIYLVRASTWTLILLCGVLVLTVYVHWTSTTKVDISRARSDATVVNKQQQHTALSPPSDRVQKPLGVDPPGLPWTVQTRADNRPLRLANIPLMEYNRSMAARFDQLVSRGASSRDPDLISLIRDMMDPPSDHMVKLSRHLVETPQSKEILSILERKMNGFFIEAGAYDGERSSNTFFLEQNLGWSGLLVEMDPYYYTQLLAKCRKAWSINACIAPSDKPSKMNFTESTGQLGKLSSSRQSHRKPAHVRTIPCFPLESLLLALNTSHVDYFSLDVEGFEMDILETVPWERLDISALSVEYEHGRRTKEEYREYMEKQGYVTHKDIRHTDRVVDMYVFDWIFVKQGPQVKIV